jgi:hypothetical protein
MLTGKKLLSALTTELSEIGLGNMATSLEEMYHSQSFWSLTH